MIINQIAKGGGSGTYQSKTIIPDAVGQTVAPDTGYDALSQVTVSGDEDLAAGNIKAGVTIFGTTGTYDPIRNDLERPLAVVNGYFPEIIYGVPTLIE